jgi:hypothetical protein
MSYQKTFQTVLRGSESATVSVGNESRTVTIHWEEPVTINVDVDTHPFDLSVAGCAHRLDDLDTHFHEAGRRQVAARAESAELVADAAEQGFHSVVKFDVDSRRRELYGKIQATTALLTQEMAEADAMHHQFHSDYTRIKSRYARIFEDLDGELCRRIRSLDATAFSLVDSEFGEKIMDPLLTQPAKAQVAGSELDTMARILGVASLKRKILELASAAGKLVSGHRNLRTRVAALLSDKPEAVVSCPVCVAVEESEMRAGEFAARTNCPTGSASFGRAMSRIEAAGEKLDLPHIGTSSVLGERFSSLLEGVDRSEETGRRVYATMIALWKQHAGAAAGAGAGTAVQSPAGSEA